MPPTTTANPGKAFAKGRPARKASSMLPPIMVIAASKKGPSGVPV
jgi:hypothetical protein